MKNDLKKTLETIAEQYKDTLSPGARNYLEVDIGKAAGKLGFNYLKDKYDGVLAVIPLNRPVRGMKVRIDGRTFVGYAEYDSGIVCPAYVAREAGLPYRTFVPNDSMIYNFA